MKTGEVGIVTAAIGLVVTVTATIWIVDYRRVRKIVSALTCAGLEAAHAPYFTRREAGAMRGPRWNARWRFIDRDRPRTIELAEQFHGAGRYRRSRTIALAVAPPDAPSMTFTPWWIDRWSQGGQDLGNAWKLNGGDRQAALELISRIHPLIQGRGPWIAECAIGDGLVRLTCRPKQGPKKVLELLELTKLVTAAIQVSE